MMLECVEKCYCERSLVGTAKERMSESFLFCQNKKKNVQKIICQERMMEQSVCVCVRERPVEQ